MLSHPRRIIFLDCDGVVARVLPNRLATARERLVPARLARLADLVEATGASVVVSSSWRTVFTVPQFSALLMAVYGPIPIVGATPVIGEPETMSAARGQEIQAWLDAHPGEVDSFVILDDWDGWCFGPLQDRLVQTDTDAGLTDADVERAARMLGVEIRAVPATEAA